MSTIGSLTIETDVASLVLQYIRHYAATNVVGDPVFDFAAKHPNEFTQGTKPVVCVYDVRVVESSDRVESCRFMSDVYFTIAVKAADKSKEFFNDQIGRIRALFSYNGMYTNRFSGQFGGSPFSNATLNDFGLGGFRQGIYQENFSHNDTFKVLQFMATVAFAKNMSPQTMHN